MGKLFVISAPSGTGKTSLIKSLLEDPMSSNTKLGISCTTREKRPKEKDGISYFFISEEEFKERVNNKNFLEYAEVFGNLYGTPKDWVLSILAKDENVILELDIQGALQVKETFPNTQTIFIIPPSYEDLTKRLEQRAQDSTEEIQRRLNEARKEITIGKDFDQIIVNNNFDDALGDLKKFIFLDEGPSKKRSEANKNSLNLLLD
ncbi:MAG: guanylate kinase [Gammaproteobacteria bacterium]|nr:MAG: guanylate kinase [Gammaproteobacteria bacterium]|tara:strand:+ start:205 stop:819 length:615 start_codon:yes stop_codon:yes gene_type:complete